MTKSEVANRVAEIRALRGDDEVQHSKEDELHRDVLLAIAEGRAEDPAGVARMALTSLRLKFNRWAA